MLFHTSLIHDIFDTLALIIWGYYFFSFPFTTQTGFEKCKMKRFLVFRNFVPDFLDSCSYIPDMGDKRENKQWISRNVFVTSLQMVMKMFFEIESTFVVSLNTLKKNNVLNSHF